MGKYLFLLIWTFNTVCMIHSERNEKSFSLFNVVKFRNSACTSTGASALKGVCFTSQECSDKGGTASGNCAASFGVCCVLTVDTCSSTVTENSTHIENPNFPAVSTGITNCQYMVTKASTDICQVRLDFLTGTFTQPAPLTGICTETITVVGGQTGNSASLDPPVLCGTLTGQHMFVDAGVGTNAATVTIANIPAPTIAVWRIRVSQIECSAPWRAPEGCLQFFTGGYGTVSSFNWDGTCTAAACVSNTMITNQDYSVCFRRESGMCSIDLTESRSVAAGNSAFLLGPAAQVTGLCTANTCAVPGNTAWISFNQDVTTEISTAAVAAGIGNVLCGGVFCGTNLASRQDRLTITPQTITSTTLPFQMGVMAIGNQVSIGGFSLDFFQKPCGSQT